MYLCWWGRIVGVCGLIAGLFGCFDLYVREVVSGFGWVKSPFRCSLRGAEGTAVFGWARGAEWLAGAGGLPGLGAGGCWMALSGWRIWRFRGEMCHAGCVIWLRSGAGQARWVPGLRARAPCRSCWHRCRECNRESAEIWPFSPLHSRHLWVGAGSRAGDRRAAERDGRAARAGGIDCGT